MRRSRRFRPVYLIAAVFGLGALTMLASCVSFQPFMIREAPLPEGWPELTPVGEIRVQEYPVYRAASVESDGRRNAMNPMFSELFGHIKKEGIAMTAPVDVGYDPNNRDAGPTRMAFLYRSTAQGATGLDGEVLVEDVQPATFASLGMRGNYKVEIIDEQVQKLSAWLNEQSAWRATGPPRYLGYNGPFVPPFLRYGEVQFPVERAETGDPESATATIGESEPQ